jgi:hypothetical protein
MELSEVTAEHKRPASTGSGDTATESHGGGTEPSLADETMNPTELGGSSEDGRVQPLLKVDTAHLHVLMKLVCL